ncbi:MFS transporter [Acidithrix sp. C25]|uniref:MFS transporter n=1 Tax=Acidithrix sp. C25 TaxID=1671482 RepID=UPI00191B9574|nr:MFS transporter [Acidithrix sp. C25]
MHNNSSAPRLKTERLTFFVTALGTYMASLDLSIVNIAFPSIEQSFPYDSRAALSWVVSGYTIIFGALLVSAGRYGDRSGRRRTFYLGLVIFSLGSALCALAPSVVTVILGRVVQGLGAAALLPASLGLLLGAFSPERRSQVVTLWAGIGALAVATGPTLGAGLISLGGWRLVFVVNIPIAIVALVLGRRCLVESERSVSTIRPDYFGVVLVTTSIASVVFGISQGASWGWTSRFVLSAFALSLVSGYWFIRRSMNHLQPVVDLSLFRIRSFSAANAATFLYAMAFFAMLLGNILFLTSVWHFSTLDAGLSITPTPIVVALVSGFAGKVARRYGFRIVMIFGSVIYACGLASFGIFAGGVPNYLFHWLPSSLIVGVGIGSTFPILSAAAVADLSPSDFGVGSALNQTARQIGGAVGVAILVVILAGSSRRSGNFGNFQDLWWYESATAIASGVFGSFLSSRSRSHSDLKASAD